jgi:hypothetical protein
MVQEFSATTQTGSRPCHYQHDAGFAGMQSLRVMGSWRHLPKFQRKAWEFRQCLTGLESLQAAHGRAMHKVLKVKPKLQWKPKEIKDARIIEFLMRKAPGSEDNQPKKDAMGAAAEKAVEVKLPKLLGTHISPLCTLNSRHGDTGFNVCLAVFQSGFGPIPLFCATFPPFWNGNVYSVPLYIGSMYFSLNFTEVHSKEFALSLIEDVGLELLSNT